MKPNFKQELVLAALVLFVLILPFSNRAVYMDEHFYLAVAQSALQHPLYPQDMKWIFFGTSFPNAADHTHPPLGEYHLAILYRVFGRFSERIFRLLFGGPYAVAAVLGFYGLALRYVSQPFWVSVLFAVCPPFVVMAPALMMDVPAVACLLLGLRLFFDAMEETQATTHRLKVAAACVCFSASLGIAYTTAIPLGGLLLWSFLKRTQVLGKAAIIVPFLCLCVWEIVMTLHFREIPLKETVRYCLTQSRPAHNMAATLSFLGGLAMFPWSCSTVLPQRNRLLVAGILCTTPPLFLFSWPSRLNAAVYLILASWGVFLLWRLAAAVAEMLREPLAPDRLFLCGWCIGSCIFFILAADMTTARYLLFYLPPLYLLVLKGASEVSLKRVVLATAALSAIIAVADYRFVGSYRTWVETNVPLLQSSGYRVWSATESGLRFYLSKYGAEELYSQDLRPRGTDLVVEHTRLFRYALSTDLEPLLVDVDKNDLTDSLPLRTFNLAAGAGFHDSRVGLIPFMFSFAPLDSVRLAQVSPFADTLPVRPKGNDDEVPIWTLDGVELRQKTERTAFRIPTLRNVHWKAELVGSGVAELGDNSIALLRISQPTAIWRNFRIVPKGY